KVRGQLSLAAALNPAGNSAERLVELLGLLPTRLSEVGPPAAASADELRHLLDQLAGREALDEVLRDGGDEIHLPLDGRPEADHTGSEPIAEKVHDRAQPFGIEAVESGCDDAHAGDFFGFRHQVLGPRVP